MDELTGTSTPGPAGTTPDDFSTPSTQPAAARCVIYCLIASAESASVTVTTLRSVSSRDFTMTPVGRLLKLTQPLTDDERQKHRQDPEITPVQFKRSSAPSDIHSAEWLQVAIVYDGNFGIHLNA